MAGNTSESGAFGAIMAGLLALVTIVIFYHGNLFHPARYLFHLDTDGMVNYFTFLWHIRYDSALLEFQGMHYPYGEYAPFVDCHPLLSTFLQCLRRLGIAPGWSGVGFLNLLMLLTPVVASAVLYQVERRLGVEQWSAICTAPALILLSSQMLLMQYGHYALTYALCVPLGWYLLIRFREAPAWKWTALIALNIVVWAYTHQYLGILLLGFTTCVHLVDLFRGQGENQYRWQRATQIFGPLVVLVIVNIFLDPHTGRIELPFNPDHTASLYSVFAPNYAMTRPFFELFWDLTPQTQQSWARVGNYIGIPSILGCFAILIIWATGAVKRKTNISLQRCGPYLVSAGVLLVIAMGWHFALTGPRWIEFVPIIKQFHGLGRFAWAFYYVIGVTTVVLISGIQHPRLRRGLVIAAAALWFLEGLGYHQQLSGRIRESFNLFDRTLNLNTALDASAAAIRPDDFQAIIPLPFYHQSITPGTFSGSERSVEYSMRLAWFTGLPLVSAMLSRYSIEEARRIIELLMPNQYDKAIRNDLHDPRPFLVMYTREPLDPYEQAVLEKGTVVFETDSLVLLDLPVEALFTFDHAQAIAAFNQETDSAGVQRGDWLSRDSTGHFEFDNFDRYAATRIYRGRGAYSAVINERHLIYRSQPLKAGVQYELSFWYYNHLYDQVYNHFWVEEWTPQDSVISRRYLSPTAGRLADHGWVWNALEVGVSQDGYSLVLRCAGEKRYAEMFYLDELMLRERGVNVLRRYRAPDSEIFLRNNQTVAQRPLE